MFLESVIEFWKANEQVLTWVMIILFVLILAVLFVISFKYETKNKTNAEKIKKMTALSILSALSVVLYYFVKFPLAAILPFIPGFLDIHFSNVPIFIGGYLFGPISGSMIVIIRFLVKLPGTSTLGVGELADLIIGLATVLVSSIVYHKYKTKKTAILTSFLIIITWTVFAVLANWLFILPFYINLYSFEGVYGMLMVIPGITETNYMSRYILFAVIPFNIIISSLVSVITFASYKRLSKIYHEL